MTTLMMDESAPTKAPGLSVASEVGKVLSFLRPAVPLADALAKRDGISEAVTLHCRRLGMDSTNTRKAVNAALACWNNGAGKSPAAAVAEGKLTANRIAYELDGGPRAA